MSISEQQFESAAHRLLLTEPAGELVGQDAGSIVTRRISEFEAKPIQWLWPGRIARGKVCILAGNPGLGKSQVTASMAAIITAAGRWPVDRAECEPGDVVFLSAEDDPADTIRPRLEAAGANLSRVHVIEAVRQGYSSDGQQQVRAFSLQRDLKALSAQLSELGTVAAVFIDPITAYLGDVDSHRNSDVRALLAPLSELAAKHDAAIIGVSHLNKSAGTDAMMRVTGSLAFVAAARGAYLVAKDPTDPARRLFLPMKNNIGPDTAGAAFRVESASVESRSGTIPTSRVVWESEPVWTTADEAMRPQQTGDESALSEAKAWLQETLKKPTPSEVVNERAKLAGISGATLRRASDSLGVVKEKSGMRGAWTWQLPSKMLKSYEDAQPNSLSTFRNFEHLRETDGVVEVEL